MTKTEEVESSTAGSSSTTFYSNMGVANKMSASDESSVSPTVISFAKIKRDTKLRAKMMAELKKTESGNAPDEALSTVFNPEGEEEDITNEKIPLGCVGVSARPPSVCDEVIPNHLSNEEEILNSSRNESEDKTSRFSYQPCVDDFMPVGEDNTPTLDDEAEISRPLVESERMDESFPNEEAKEETEKSSETKRRGRGRPPASAKKLTSSSTSISPDKTLHALTEPESRDAMTVEDEEQKQLMPKRTRTRPKRFADDEVETGDEQPKVVRSRPAKGSVPKRAQDDTSSDSSSVPAKKKRGRPPKNDVTEIPTTPVNPVMEGPIRPKFCDVIKDDIEEDLSESSSDVTVDRWYNSNVTAAESKSLNPTPQQIDSTCPSPALSSASSSLSSCTNSPLRGSATSAKRSRGRPRIANMADRLNVSQVQASDRPQPTTPNGISPRKIHKKFGKFCPPPPSSLSPSVKNFNTKQDIATTTMLNGLSENETPAKTFSQQQSAPSTPDHVSSMMSPGQSMKVKSRWRLSSIEQQQQNETSPDQLELSQKSKQSSKESSRAPTPVTPVPEKPSLSVDINTLEETKAEIRKRLDSFYHITENTFLCERRYNKESRGMDCDCTMSKEDIAKGRKGCGDDCLNRLLFIECGKSCSLGKRCSNKRFQMVENAPTEVFKTDYKGFGVRATRDIHPDTFLMEYVGEVLDPRQFRKRARKYASDDVQHFYFMALSSEYFIDASSKGSISRFINHSCDPNAETQKWTVNGELRVGFFSRRVIKQGEEITFDYKYERYGQHAQKCYCGAKICRGWLGGEPDKENRKPVPAEVDSDDDYWSSTTSDEEDVVTKQQQQQLQREQQREQHEPSSPVIRYNNQLSKLKSLRRKKSLRSTRKIKNFEDQEYEEETERLKATGIRTKTHTVELCRLMVRVIDLNTKLTLASLLRTADSPCRRLFLDYHGLKILNNWMSELGNSSRDLDLKLSIEDTLSALNIPHKTMLVDSKVWLTINRWSNPDFIEDRHQAAPSTESSRATTPDQQSVHSTPSKSVTASSFEVPTLSVNQVSLEKLDDALMPSIVSAKIVDEDLSKVDVVMQENVQKCDSTEDVANTIDNVIDVDRKEIDVNDVDRKEIDVKDVESKPSPDSSVEIPTIESDDIVATSDETSASSTAIDIQKKSDAAETPEIKREDSEIVPDLENQTSKSIMEIVSSQKVENQDFGYEKVNENSPVEVAPIAKPEQAVPEKSSVEESDAEIDEKIRTVRAKAIALLAQWSNLQEFFKIPKRELLAMRAAHEREVDRAAAAATYETRSDHFSNRALPKPVVMQSGYERANNRHHRPDSPTKRERRLSRFDDCTGFVNAPNLSREQRRNIFSRKAELEEDERRKRALLQQQHENKCYYLRLDPAITPMFPQNPDFFFDPNTSQWHQMPEAYPKIDADWGYAGMALLPHEAFKIGDAPLPDPAFIYPPGVVPVSYCYGHPMSLDPSLLPVTPPLPPMPPPVDITEIPLPLPLPTTYIDSATGEEVPIPEIQPGYVPQNGGDESAFGVSPSKKLSRPDFAPSLHSALEAPITNGFEHEPAAWLARQIETHPHYLVEYDSAPSSQIGQLERPVAAGSFVPIAQAVSTTPVSAASNGSKKSEKVEIVVKLPLHWKMAKDPEGRPYYYHARTKETRWEPPTLEESPATVIESADEIAVVEMETASTDSEGQNDEMEEDGEESDDEDEDDSDKEEDEENGNSAAEKIQKILMPNPENAILSTTGDVLYSDLSAHEKELLLKSSRKKSKEERQNERRYKRERDREKREYEKKRRRERHGKHRRDGLVQEHLIPRRTERDKTDLMSLKELKDRLANRVQIREEQEMEEMAELEREREEERARRNVEHERRIKIEREQQAAVSAMAVLAMAANAAEMDVRSAVDASSRPTTAAADTSSEVVKKIKDRFMKDASKIIVKLLDPYRKPDVKRGHIQNTDDFKHLAKKLTGYLLAKESSRCKRIEDLKVSDSVKKKAGEFVKKYMAKFGDVYKRSPSN